MQGHTCGALLGSPNFPLGPGRDASTADLVAGPAYSPHFGSFQILSSLYPSPLLSKSYSSLKAQLQGHLLHEASMLLSRLKKAQPPAWHTALCVLLSSLYQTYLHQCLVCSLRAGNLFTLRAGSGHMLVELNWGAVWEWPEASCQLHSVTLG